MATWAAIAKNQATKTPPAPLQQESKPSVAVIDANAIINRNGLLNLMRTYEKIVTIPEVLREVRDKQSRAALDALPYQIQTQEPSEDSVKAIVSFAKLTGDLHALSTVDTRLLALTHTLEVAYYGGTTHLRSHPPAPKIQKKRVKDTKTLPGWGAEGGEWAEIDRLNREEEEAAKRVLLGAQPELDDTVDDLHNTNGTNSSSKIVQGNLVGGQGEVDHVGSAVEQLTLLDVAESDEEEESDDDDDDGWEVAAKTKNKARRAKRKAYRRAENEAVAGATAEQQEEDDDDDEAWETEEEEESEEDKDSEEEEEDKQNVIDSVVSCVTADFAMQNVLLQMGLRLSAPDGRQIASVSRWVLRCSACFQVTKEVGRLFCPRCGNATLDRVRVVVGPDGAEQYGVKKKHVLRGTKFSLPKPRGGRHRDPILREDQLLSKKHLLRAQKAAEQAAADQLDPFAPEYTADTWHQSAAVPGGVAGGEALLAGWKHNPNERKHRATNRRRK